MVSASLGGASSASSAPDGTAASSEDIRQKAQQKLDYVQKFLENLEDAVRRNSEEDRDWLKQIIEPSDPCFRTLIQIILAPKYQGFARLCASCLRASQMILRIAVSTVSANNGAAAKSFGAGLGLRCLTELAGEKMAREALPEVRKMAERSLAVADEDELARICDALLVLAELGPEALEPRLVLRLLDLFVHLPDRGDELVEVALRLHAWGGRIRSTLLEGCITHEGGSLLGAILLQVINRSDEVRVHRAVKLVTGAMAQPGGENFLYTNDTKVLVEILHRELPNHSSCEEQFAILAECFRELISRCPPARAHRKDESEHLFRDISEDPASSDMVRAKCGDVLAALSRGDRLSVG